jgi:hypothetical protein
MATQNAIGTVEIDKAVFDAKGDLLVGLTADTPVILTIGSEGQILKVTSGTPAWSDSGGDTDEKAGVSADDTTPGYLDGKLTAGNGISLTVGSPAGNETLAIAVTGGGLAWVVTADDATMDANKGYIPTDASTRVVFTLPSSAAQGSVVRVVGSGAAGWQIAQAASQLINFGTVVTTTGTGGSLASTDDKDCVELVCIVVNTTWVVVSAVGNITYV